MSATPDTFVATCSEAMLMTLASDLGVARWDAAESIDAFRARVAAAYADDATVDRAVVTTLPAKPAPALGGMVLGGMTIGEPPPAPIVKL